MLEQLIDLAKQPDADKRRELLRQVADLFYAEDRDHVAEREIMLFGSVVTRLLKDLSAADRTDFSSRVAADLRTPHDVALALAHDEAGVAAPVLENSTSLDDDDLIEVARSRGLGHRVAISKRDGVGERVTDALLDFGETEVMASLLDNKTSILSAHAFEMMAARAESVAQLRDRLCFRNDTPAAVLTRMLPLLGPEAQAQARAMLAAGGNKLDELSKAAMGHIAKERGDNAKRRLEIKMLARRVEAGEVGMDGFVDDLVSHHHPLDLALGLSELSMLAEKQISNAVLALEPAPLALICKALEMEPDTYRRAETLRREVMKQPLEIPANVMSAYGLLSAADAQRTLRFVSVRGTLAKTG